jgi:hypothetical protein
MSDAATMHRTLDEGHDELEAIRGELLQRMEREPENGELRRDAFEVSGLAERVAWLLDNLENDANPRLLFTGDLDLALLDRYANEAATASPYRGDQAKPQRAARVRALRSLLSVNNYGASPA